MGKINMFKELIAFIWKVIFIVFCSFGTLSAQECDDILGTVFFSDDFGSGTEQPGPPLPEGTTTYNHGSIGGGNYMVSNTTGLNSSLWHKSPDHTPDDENGYCLVFDASSSPGIFYRRLFEDLCGNTNYSFSCYVANLARPHVCSGNSVEPNLKFSLIDPALSTEIASLSTGDIPTTEEIKWSQYSISFTTNDNQQDIVIEISNNTSGGCGNDLAIDDFTFHICNPNCIDDEDCSNGIETWNPSTCTCSQLDIPEQNESNCIDDNDCSNGIETWNDESCACEQLDIPDPSTCIDDNDCSNGIETWNDESCACEQLDIPDPSTCIDDNDCSNGIETWNNDSCACEQLNIPEPCIEDDSCETAVQRNPETCECETVTQFAIPNAGEDNAVTFCQMDTSFSLINQLLGTPDLGGIWSRANGEVIDDLFEIATITSPSIFTLTYTVTDGDCENTSQLTVAIEACNEPQNFVLPSAFSPNGDGLNDDFGIDADNIDAIELYIYDRWGEQLFHTTTLNEKWDGTFRGEFMPMGVYVYFMEVTINNQPKVFLKGNVTIIK